jgi:hypothetical protein
MVVLLMFFESVIVFDPSWFQIKMLVVADLRLTVVELTSLPDLELRFHMA